MKERLGEEIDGLKRKPLQLVIAMSLVLVIAIAGLPPVSEASNGAKSATATEVLAMAVMENVTILENGASHVTLMINVSSSPLAETYRDNLAAPPDVGTEEEMTIPENMTIPWDIELGENVTLEESNMSETVIPVREELLRAISQEQQYSLGLNITEIFDSRMVPKGSNNECRVSINASASLQIVNVTIVDSNEIWEIAIGPLDGNATNIAAEFVYTKIAYLQQMLESLPDEQTYENVWTTRINLPANATLLNGNQLAGLNWTVDFGGGTFLNASVSLDGNSTIILDEKMVVAEQNITATPEELSTAFQGYKVFEIEYLLNSSMSGSSLSRSVGGVNGDFEYRWSLTLWRGTVSTGKERPCSEALLRATSEIKVSGYIGCEFSWFRVQWFEAWIKPEASVEVQVTVGTMVDFSKTWEWDLYSWDTTFRFSVGWVPVWADLEFTVKAVLEINVDAGLTVTAKAEASGWFKAGVRWDRNVGWQMISESDLSLDYSGPTTTGMASASVRPSLEARLALLLYKAAGPYVEFELYAEVILTLTLPCTFEWNIEAGFNINCGITFTDLSKEILDRDIDDFSWTLLNVAFNVWDGVFSCLVDFGDAPDDTYPSTLAKNGARHAVTNYEWLGDKPSIEIDSRQVNMDSDDGVELTDLCKLAPGGLLELEITISTSGDPCRYDPNDPKKKMYLNAWLDWNNDGWQPSEKIISSEAYTSPKTRLYRTAIPKNYTGTIWLRVRLDYGENVGNVQDKSGNLIEEKGQAMYGEVEDHRYTIRGGEVVTSGQVRFKVYTKPPGIVVTQGYKSWTVTVLVTVKNLNDTYSAYCNVTLSYTDFTGEYVIGVANVTLAPLTNETLAFNWTLADVSYCSKILNATAHVPGDPNATNNIFITYFKVKAIGDVDNDGTRGVLDVILVFINAGPSPPAWVQADVDGDCSNGVLDVILIFINAGPYSC